MFNSAMHLIPTAIPAAQTAASGGVETVPDQPFAIEEVDAAPTAALEQSGAEKPPAPDVEDDGLQAIEQVLWAISAKPPVARPDQIAAGQSPTSSPVPTMAENALNAKLHPIDPPDTPPVAVQPDDESSQGAKGSPPLDMGAAALDDPLSPSPTSEGEKDASSDAVAGPAPLGDRSEAMFRGPDHEADTGHLPILTNETPTGDPLAAATAANAQPPIRPADGSAGAPDSARAPEHTPTASMRGAERADRMTVQTPTSIPGGGAELAERAHQNGAVDGPVTLSAVQDFDTPRATAGDSHSAGDVAERAATRQPDAVAAPGPAIAPSAPRDATMPRELGPGIAHVRIHQAAPSAASVQTATPPPLGIDAPPVHTPPPKQQGAGLVPTPAEPTPPADPQTILATDTAAPPIPTPAMPTASAPGTVPAHAHNHGMPAPLPPPVTQVADAVRSQAADQPGRIEILLAPESLGRVHFDMRHEAGGLAITLSAERPETLDLMRRHLPDLVADLKQAGIQTSSFSFGSWGDGRKTPGAPKDKAVTGFDGAPPPVQRLSLPPRQVVPAGSLNIRL